MTAAAPPNVTPPAPPRSASPLGFLTDLRFLQIVGQIIFVIVLVAAVYALLAAILTALADEGLTPNTAFLGDRAGFDIGDKPAWYSANGSYWDAYIVGLFNTIRVVVLGLILTTIFGIFGGIFLLSRNWLLRSITAFIVEVLRNTPLLLQLIVWYFVVILSLPPFQESLALPSEGITIIPLRTIGYVLFGLYIWGRLRGLTAQQERQRRITLIGAVAIVALIEIAVRLGWIGGGGDIRFEVYPWAYINIRGFAFPAFIATARLAEWLAFVGIGVALALVQWIYYGRLREATGRRFPRALYGIVAIAAFAVVGWLIVTSEPAAQVSVTDASGAIVLMPLEEARAEGLLTLEDEVRTSNAPFIFQLPSKNNFRFLSGTPITPEFVGLLLGLVIYTAAFIAEIVRAGILAVPKGQVEAARALGLSQVDVLQRVILPQALRVIIPPLGNQYLNLAKNSSLAIPIAFADVFSILTTIMNQSGQSVTGMLMAMVTYLIGSLIIAYFMNVANRRFQLVTR